MNFSQYTNKSAEEVLEIFKTSAEGLSRKEALLHQEKFGFNEIKFRNICRYHLEKTKWFDDQFEIIKFGFINRLPPLFIKEKLKGICSHNSFPSL